VTAGGDARPPRTFLGRAGERALLDRLLADARAGRSAALVLRGEAGIGKTALLRYAARQAAGFRVVRVAGVEAEMELPFAGVHQLCAPMLEAGLDALPEPQRAALTVALGLAPGPPPDPFLVGLAVLGLLSAVAEARPLLCLVDDAQWLDQASARTLAFVARRLLAESAVMLLATRDPGEALVGLPELVVHGLRAADARALLAATLRGRLDERVREQLVAETRGNPLALLELPRAATPADLAGGFALPAALSLTGRLEESFLRRLAPLADEARRLLVAAAADPLGDPALLASAARRAGIDEDALDEAVSAGLLEVDTRVRFHHPLVRSAVYRDAPADERRAVHRVLGEVTDPTADPDRRAWHRALGAAGPDDGIAAELERSAGRAQARGGLAAAAAFLERSAALTRDRTLRARRLVAAARAKHLAGASDTALGLLASAEAVLTEEHELAAIGLLRAQICAAGRGSDAPALLLRAAERLAPLDARLARDTYLEAFAAAEFAAHLARGAGLADVAAEAAAAPPPPDPPAAADRLLDGLTALFTAGPAASAGTLAEALRALRREDAEDEAVFRWSWLAGRVAIALWDDETWDALTTRHVRAARATGALSALPLALSNRITLDVFAGSLPAATAHLEELRAVTAAIGAPLPPYAPVFLACWQGDEPEARLRIERAEAEAGARGEGLGLKAIGWASAVLENSLGRHEEALAAATRTRTGPGDVWLSDWSRAELILAAVRCGERRRAAAELEQLAARTRAAGTMWGLGIEARARALLSTGAEAEARYREAIDRLGRTRIRVELGRAHLHYGEWLRGEGRRLDAREQLGTAHELFARTGLAAFAERAEHELALAGQRARRRAAGPRDELTDQERQIALLARDGLSNPEIGVRLFLSPRTVEWHLRKVFAKLGIRSRRELADALGAEPVPA
jgi:DNA-binding CsgD family transcriptional regulator